MPSPGAPAPRTSLEDSYLELLTDTLETLEPAARGQFLQRYLRTVTQVELPEGECLRVWEEMLVRRRQLSEALHRNVSPTTALLDVFSTSGMFRVPVIMEYEDLKRLQLNAFTDALTNLYNRRVFSETFDKELNRAKRYGLPLGLVVMDMHRFKEVNDQHGHPRGDQVLRLAADTFKKALRTADSAFRIGGDEFALLLPQTDMSQAVALSRRIEIVFAENLKALHLNVVVGMDHGVAHFPQDGDTTETLIHIADERLYERKHTREGRSPESTSRGPVASSREVPSVETAPLAPQASPTTEQKPAASDPAPIPIESKRVPEKPEIAEQKPARVETSAPSEISPKPATPSKPAHTFVTPRKAERVSMVGTNAYALLGEQSARRARVLDLGFGGVALELDSTEGLPESFHAILHVPILPPVRVNLKPVWSRRTDAGVRVGCTFVS